MTPLVAAEGVGVRFLFDGAQRTVTPRIARIRRGVTEAWGLREVTFAVGPGEAVALLGPSGAGKSTLLRTIAGVFAPDTGTLRVTGRVGTLLSIDAGLMGALTGRENGSLVAVLAGLGRREAREKLDSVAAESALGASFDRPVGSYSQGMRARLGFAIAMESDPDVLLLDEVHEALDHAFRLEVERRAKALVERGGIVIAAGHDHPLLERICTRALLLEGGRLVADGRFADVQATYFVR
jgi:ABC-type polysaccharide/polyol phosphate transport system ATPase subunit